MSRIYDNWERLVDAVLKRDLYRQLAMAPSFDSTVSDSTVSDWNVSESFSSRLSFDSPAYDLKGLFRSGVWLGDERKRILAKPIHLSDQVIKAAVATYCFKQECSDLKLKSEKLAGLLCQAARSTNELSYERPTSRIIANTEQVLDNALSLVLKCQGSGLVNRMFTLIPTVAFQKMSSQLESSIGDVSWLLCISAPAGDRVGEYLSLPPIAADEPILCLVWEQIAILYTGSVDDRVDAAASIVSLAHENELYGKMIVEEGGVGPLLKLLKEGKSEGQENAARAIGLLGKDPESVDRMINAGVCWFLVNILQEGTMRVQAVAAWATSELVARHRKCQDFFVRHNIIPLLVNHLAFETLEEYATISNGNKAREMEDSETKAYHKEMAARALWQLAIGNLPVCRKITQSRAFLCFAVLLDKGPKGVRYMSAMALMEISVVAERDAELRRSAFRPNSPACKAVMDQLFRVIEKADSKLLVPCVIAIGNLARTFRATETRMIGPLVKLLNGEQGIEVSEEACTALTKFACSENYLCPDHSKAIVDAGGAKHLVQLVYFGEKMLQNSALVLLSYIALHVPDSVELARGEVLTVLEWASKKPLMTQKEKVEMLLTRALGKLELYQSKGFHEKA